MPITIDVFAGCGGLARDLSDAGFHVAAQTFRWHNLRTRLIEKDIRQVSADYVLTAADNRSTSLVAGCAPRQGFCSPTAKSKKEEGNETLSPEIYKAIR